MRGGLDDALEKLERRNQLRRRAIAQPPATSPPAVTELVESVAAVVARYPELRVAVGVEGVGAPAALRIWAHEGVPHVSMEPVATEPYDDPVPADPVPGPGASRAGVTSMVGHPEPFYAPDPTSAGWGATSGLTAPPTDRDHRPDLVIDEAIDLSLVDGTAAGPGRGHTRNGAGSGPGRNPPPDALDHATDRQLDYGTDRGNAAGVRPATSAGGQVPPPPDPAGPASQHGTPGFSPPPAAGFPPPPAAETDRRTGPGQETTVRLRRPAEPLVIPSSEPAARRLAALLRENPSLLHGTNPPPAD